MAGRGPLSLSRILGPSSPWGLSALVWSRRQGDSGIPGASVSCHPASRRRAWNSRASPLPRSTGHSDSEPSPDSTLQRPHEGVNSGRCALLWPLWKPVPLGPGQSPSQAAPCEGQPGRPKPPAPAWLQPWAGGRPHLDPGKLCSAPRQPKYSTGPTGVEGEVALPLGLAVVLLFSPSALMRRQPGTRGDLSQVTGGRQTPPTKPSLPQSCWVHCQGGPGSTAIVVNGGSTPHTWASLCLWTKVFPSS